MIYAAVPETNPIQQGDIFQNVPMVDFSLDKIAIVDEQDEPRETSWREAMITQNSRLLTAVLPIKAVVAIVITQNCDAARGQFLSLCRVDEYLSITNQTAPKNPKGWQALITKMARQSRFFYLPEDDRRGITSKMAADFRVVLPVRRFDLENMRDQRIGRLNNIALDHFRESLAHFFKRYAYDEWYPLTREEYQEYAESHREPGTDSIRPFPWQEPPLNGWKLFSCPAVIQRLLKLLDLSSPV